MSRGQARSKIMDAAERLFSEKWYSTVSVADICRKAGVSNGIAYHYFDDKEAILRALMENTLEVVSTQPRLNGEDDAGKRLLNYIVDLKRVTVDNRHLIRAFRQGQYRYLEYERRLHSIYLQHLSRVMGREVGEAEYTYMLSGLRFVNIRHSFDGHGADETTLKAIVAEGLFPGGEARALDEFLPKRILPPAVDFEQTYRKRILKAGKGLFGRHDFSAVGVAEIVREAGASVGTFYNCFESKEALLSEIISGMSREVRFFISLNMPKGLTRLEEELAGIYLFCLYLTFDPDCYPVVRQGEYVVPDAARQYYDSFLKGYMRRMDWLPEGWDGNTAANYMMGIAHYFGLELAFSKDIKDAKESLGGLVEYYKGGCIRREVS